MEGKRNDWEGVVLIPFIDEARLLAASYTVGPAKLSRVRYTAVSATPWCKRVMWFMFVILSLVMIAS